MFGSNRSWQSIDDDDRIALMRYVIPRNLSNDTQEV